ncbi:hypothetical protein AVEN_269887-1 [Araneus ventricosus]|uniref:Uncharacterized protein n=1 Tax=Araneus ventricosus TaxID=182803 RepID=A0A4Y2IDD5_ARAVE|nr:hypothetical protein AVEN_269887-1 [Araneus ventricosus]
MRATKHVHHSPDLALSDFQLSGPFKKNLVGHYFRSEAEVQEIVIKWLQDLEPDFFYVGFSSMSQMLQQPWGLTNAKIPLCRKHQNPCPRSI